MLILVASSEDSFIDMSVRLIFLANDDRLAATFLLYLGFSRGGRICQVRG